MPAWGRVAREFEKLRSRTSRFEAAADVLLYLPRGERHAVIRWAIDHLGGLKRLKADLARGRRSLRGQRRGGKKQGVASPRNTRGDVHSAWRRIVVMVPGLPRTERVRRVAEELDVSERTVWTHVRRLL